MITSCTFARKKQNRKHMIIINDKILYKQIERLDNCLPEDMIL